MEPYFDFEKPITELEKKLVDLRSLSQQENVDLSKEIRTLENKLKELITKTVHELTPWQRIQISRHPGRPYSQDYIDLLFQDFIELHGDRCYGDDAAIIGGIATLQIGGKKAPFVIIAQQKGRTTKQKLERNFGMAKPEGYRKAQRLMEMADRFGLPLLTLIDTPGAYPGIDAEERGQSQAIAESILKLFTLKVPTVAVIIGEGGSGGALALGVADRVMMFQFSVYSVISPESCASILWNDSSFYERASEGLKLESERIKKQGVVDEIIDEPMGGAHRDWKKAAQSLHQAISHAFENLKASHSSVAHLLEARKRKFRRQGVFALASAELKVGKKIKTPKAKPLKRKKSK